MPIKFGTDGWRDKMTADFTMENVEKVAQAFINYFENNCEAEKGFFVGFDNRKNSEHFARAAAEVISGNGYPVYLSEESLPTQLTSFAVVHHDLCAGVMITASHNPAEYNGFKIKEKEGCSSFPETTDGITKLIGKKKVKKSAKNIEIYNPKNDYYQYLEDRIDFNAIKKAGIKVYVDPLYGSGSNYISGILKKHKIESVEINNYRDVTFGGHHPEPLAYNIPDFLELIEKAGEDFAVGLVLDGDGDRNGAVGNNGDFINSQKVFSLLLHHFGNNLKKEGKIVHAFNNTRLLDRMAADMNKEVITTRIGFKYIADEILKGDVMIGGEESGGYAASGNLPERDGVLNSLYLLDLMAHENKTLDDIYSNLEEKYGKYAYDRLDLKIDNHIKEKVITTLADDKFKMYNERIIVKKEDLDGIKINFSDNSWLLFRASGTEPLLRIYCEADSVEKVAQMLTNAEKFVNSVK